MGTLKFVNIIDRHLIMEIDPTITVKGQAINHVVIINENDTELIAAPSDEQGNPIKGSWKYTAEGVTMESLYELVVRLKKINNNTKERKA